MEVFVKKERKAISNKVRFEVFKRDGFKCQYCGRSAPDVVLQVDHIIPVCEGGDNDLLNLVTACFDCNNGKRGKMLDDSTVVSKQIKQMQELNDRREQLELIAEWRKGLQDIETQKAYIVINELMHRYGKPPDFKPSVNSVAAALDLVKSNSMEDIFTAIDRSVGKHTVLNVNVFRTIKKNLKFLKIPVETQQLLYTKGIIRNRLEGQHYSDCEAMSILSEAFALGTDIKTLQDMAKEVVSWEQFERDFSAISNIPEDAYSS